jgi:hypothetical protein
MNRYHEELLTTSTEIVLLGVFMAAFNPVAGVLAAVQIGSVSLSFDKWELDMDSPLPDVSNFNGLGFSQNTIGLVKGKVVLTGPYDQGNMPFVTNQMYNLVLYWNVSITLTCAARLQSIKATQDVRDAGRVSLTFESNGVFVAAIV